MPSVVAYHRPIDLDDAANLLKQPRHRALGGGTVVVPEARLITEDGVSVVDLQDLGLNHISVDSAASELTIGSGVTLGGLIENPNTPQLLCELAGRELPSTMRFQATIGGTVAQGNADSLLLAGLLVHDAMVHCHGEDAVSLSQFLRTGAGTRLVTSITIDLGVQNGAVASTGRTPADVPIVAAVAAIAGDETVRLALTGVASTPVLVAPANHADPRSALNPPSDFRGSSQYRLHLADVLAKRVLAQLDPTTQGANQ